MSHECPAPNCNVTMGDDKLACSPHWFQLPHQLRQKINTEYRSHGLSARLRVLQNEAFDFWVERAGVK